MKVMTEVPFAYCCSSLNVAACDCVEKNHGTAYVGTNPRLPDGYRYRWKIDGAYTDWQVVKTIPPVAVSYAGFEMQPLFSETVGGDQATVIEINHRGYDGGYIVERLMRNGA